MWPKWLTLPCFSFQAKKWCIQYVHILKWIVNGKRPLKIMASVTQRSVFQQCGHVRWFCIWDSATSTHVRTRYAKMLSRTGERSWNECSLASQATVQHQAQVKSTVRSVHWYAYQVQWSDPKMNANCLLSTFKTKNRCKKYGNGCAFFHLQTYCCWHSISKALTWSQFTQGQWWGSQALCDQQHTFLIWWRNRAKQSNISRNGIYAFGLLRACSGTHGSQWDSANSFTPDLTFTPSPSPRLANKKNNIALWGFSSNTNK